MERETRKQVLSYVQALRTYMPGMEHAELAVIGPALGFRETRKLVGKETITVDDVLARRKRDNSVPAAAGSQRSTRISIRWQPIWK